MEAVSLEKEVRDEKSSSVQEDLRCTCISIVNLQAVAKYLLATALCSSSARVGMTETIPKLVQFALDIAKDALLKHLSLGKNLLHGHAGNQHTRLALDDALDNAGHVRALVSFPALGLRQQHGILHQGITAVLSIARRLGLRRIIEAAAVGAALVDVGPDGEDDWESKL